MKKSFPQAVRPRIGSHAPGASEIGEVIRKEGEVPELRHLSVGDIVQDPGQPRQAFTESELADLAEDIKKRGVRQPLEVRPVEGGRFQLITGERRLRASRLAGILSVPCLVRADYTDEEILIARIQENLQREDLTAVEYAKSFRQYKEMTGKTWDEVGEDFGQKGRKVMKIAGLASRVPEEVQALNRERKLSDTDLMEIYHLPAGEQVELANRILRENLTTEQIREEKRKGSAAPPSPPEPSVPVEAGTGPGAGTGTPQSPLSPLPARLSGRDPLMGHGDEEIRFRYPSDKKTQLLLIARRQRKPITRLMAELVDRYLAESDSGAI